MGTRIGQSAVPVIASTRRVDRVRSIGLERGVRQVEQETEDLREAKDHGKMPRVL